MPIRTALVAVPEPLTEVFVFLILVTLKKAADLMSLVTFTVFMGTLGLVVRERERLMSAGTGYESFASPEAQRAREFGLLLGALMAPWLVIAAILLS